MTNGTTESPMARSEPNAGELFVRALDQVVGGIALARYAAAQTRDSGLKSVFQDLVVTGERQESLLRRRLRGYPGPLDAQATSARRIVRLVAGLAAVATGFGAAALTYRTFRAGRLPSQLGRR